jgi:excinuclease ABC subunit B
MSKGRQTLIKELVDSHYERNDMEFVRGHFRVRGDTVEVFPAYADIGLRVEFFGDEIEKVSEFNPIDGHTLKDKEAEYIYPASHFVISQEKINIALSKIEQELVERVAELKKDGKLLEAQRLDQRTRYDMEMMRLTGVCPGIENYSRVLADRAPGSRPECLIDYFNAALHGNKNDYMIIIDESHITVPQIRGMYAGDRARKETLVKYGFRLPSALDNRPLKFPEFEKLSPQTIYASATPGPYELIKTGGAFTELVIRPTGLVDPEVQVRPIKGQIDDLMAEIRVCVAKKYRVLVTTLTKRLSEDLTEYLKEKDFRVQYLHSEIDALSRIEILKNLRQGKFDVLVGINLLREGLDLPEVGLVAVLDADKEGFLRSETTLIQICGRAARNVDGKVILYADVMTGSMQRALGEMTRRRVKQVEYNKVNHITPKSVVTAVHNLQEFEHHAKEEGLVGMFRETEGDYIAPKQMHTVITELENQMKQAADNLDFETAAIFRDRIVQLKEMSAQRKQKPPRKTVRFKK